MNTEHYWRIKLAKIEERIQERESILSQACIINPQFILKTIRETLKVQLLRELIGRIRLTIDSINRAADWKVRAKLIKKYSFDVEFVRRYIFKLDPPLILRESDDQNNHIKNCDECKNYIKNIRSYYKPLSTAINSWESKDITEEFDKIGLEIIKEHIEVLKEELTRQLLLPNNGFSTGITQQSTLLPQ